MSLSVQTEQVTLTPSLKLTESARDRLCACSLVEVKFSTEPQQDKSTRRDSLWVHTEAWKEGDVGGVKREGEV